MITRLFLAALVFTSLIARGGTATPDASNRPWALKAAVVMPGEKVYLTFLDRAKGSLIQWVPVGAKLNDSTVVSAYDAKRSVATLLVGAEKIEVGMDEGSILEGQAEPGRLVKGLFTIRTPQGEVTSVKDTLRLGETSRIYVGNGQTLQLKISAIDDQTEVDGKKIPGPMNGNYMIQGTLETAAPDSGVAKTNLMTVVTLPNTAFAFSISSVIQLTFQPEK